VKCKAPRDLLSVLSPQLDQTLNTIGLISLK
jgi:hypothetical protein